MRIVVCCKQVPDTSARLQAREGMLEPHCPGVLAAMNPYDEFALEEALRIRESAGEGEIVLLFLSSEPVEETAFHGLAMGADRCVSLELGPNDRPDSLAAAELLAAEIRAIGPDLVFCGERAVDSDAAQTGPILAELLGWPQVCAAESSTVEPGGAELRARCRRGDSFHVIVSPVPCVATFVRGDRLPRYPSLDAIFGANAKPLDIKAVSPSRANGVKRVWLKAPDEERGGEMISADSPDVAVDLLLNRIEEKTHVL